MTFDEQVDAAIMAHIQWVTRIRKAIRTGRSDFDPVVARAHNRCEFSRWLYGDFQLKHGKEPIFDEICQLHTRFHELAGFILEESIAGRAEEVQKLMDFMGEFNQLSGKLLLKLISLKQ